MRTLAPRRFSWAALPLLAACAGKADEGADPPDDTAESGADSGQESDSATDSSDTGDSSDTTDTGDTGGGLDPLDLAAEVDTERLQATIEALAGLGTRYTFSDGDEAAADWLVTQVEALGLEAELDPFDVDGTTATNVITRVEGRDPSAVWIYQAHYDSTSNRPDTEAPGADDNASGVAAVLEAARILSGYQLEHTVIFVFTAAEEQGSLGSAHLADRYDREGLDVRGVMAPDMMAFWPLGDEDAFDILGDADSQHLVEDMAGAADALGVAHKVWIEHEYCYGDDHTNWQESGFPAISPMDCVEAHNVGRSGESTPHYHRTTDTPDTLYLPFTTQVVRVSVATLAGWAGVEGHR